MRLKRMDFYIEKKEKDPFLLRKVFVFKKKATINT